jgi:coenzyme F420-reducing hydrogenase delta subunit
MAFSACQQLGVVPRYIDSEDVSPVYGKRTLITVTCSDDVNISFVIKAQSKKEQGI